jgi:hypothetical protein
LFLFLVLIVAIISFLLKNVYKNNSQRGTGVPLA